MPDCSDDPDSQLRLAGVISAIKSIRLAEMLNGPNLPDDGNDNSEEKNLRQRDSMP